MPLVECRMDQQVIKVALVLACMADRGSRSRLDMGDRGSTSRLDMGDRGSMSRLDMGDRGSMSSLDMGDRGSMSRLDMGDRGSMSRLDMGDQGRKVAHMGGLLVEWVDRMGQEDRVLPWEGLCL